MSRLCAWFLTPSPLASHQEIVSRYPYMKDSLSSKKKTQHVNHTDKRHPAPTAHTSSHITHNKVANGKNGPQIVIIGSHFQITTYNSHPTQLPPTMQEWVLNLLLAAGLLAAITLLSILICIADAPSRHEQGDEENPTGLDQPREARASSAQGGSSLEYILFLAWVNM